MKKIKVIKRLNYKKCPVYIRALDSRFEYLVVYNNQLYSHYINIEPSLLNRFLKEKYTKEQLDKIVKLLFIMACKTIDGLLKKNKLK